MKKISKREKNLILIAVLAVSFFIIFEFLITPLLGYYDRIKKELPKLKIDALAAVRLKKQYLALDKEIKGNTYKNVSE